MNYRHYYNTNPKEYQTFKIAIVTFYTETPIHFKNLLKSKKNKKKIIFLILYHILKKV